MPALRASLSAPGLALAALCSLGPAACSSPPVAGSCAVTSDCAPGTVCVNSQCAQLCRSDVDCPAGAICATDICEAGQRGGSPIIMSVNGTGSVDGAPGHTENHLATNLEIIGADLLGGRVTLSGAGQESVLEVCETPTATRLLVSLPGNLVAGEYTLAVATQAGACATNLPILQGEPGTPGLDGDMGPTGPAGPAILPSAAVTGSCSTAGELAFHPTDRALWVCDGVSWRPAGPRLGSQHRPARHCREILEAGDSRGSGVYWLQTSGDAHQGYCDMTTEGGGWTLFWYNTYGSGVGASGVLTAGSPTPGGGAVSDFTGETAPGHYHPPFTRDYLDNGWASEILVRDLELDRYLRLDFKTPQAFRKFFVTETPWDIGVSGTFTTDAYDLDVVLDQPREVKPFNGVLFRQVGFGLGSEANSTACATAGLGYSNSSAHDYEQCPKHILYSNGTGADSVERGTIGFNNGAGDAMGAYFVR